MNPHILFVDDEPPVREMLALYFRKKNFAVTTAVTVKEALVAHCGTVTVAGTSATVLSLLDSETTIPPAGACWFSVTVPVDEDPPVTLAGPRASAPKLGGSIVSVAVWVMPA